MPKHPESDKLINAAAKRLIDNGFREEAAALLTCTLERIELGAHFEGVVWNGQVECEPFYPATITLRGPSSAYEMFDDSSYARLSCPARVWDVWDAMDAMLNGVGVTVTAVRVISDEEEAVVTKPGQVQVIERITNNDGVHVWKGLRFGSKSELRIAQALDAAGVLFFPNSKVRLSGMDGRENRVPDFLVCKDGKWGILEVDGEPYHPPTRTVYDHARDELFRLHGIRVVQHYDAKECYETPRSVVERFLNILEKVG